MPRKNQSRISKGTGRLAHIQGSQPFISCRLFQNLCQPSTNNGRYFLFHATLIPVHCLRQNPHHALAPDWRAQIQASLSIMGAMAELNPNSSKCRDITLKLCWPHLDEEGARTYCDNAPFVPSVGDSEAASIINGYNTWCESMTNAGISVPYDWADDNDSALGFF